MLRGSRLQFAVGASAFTAVAGTRYPAGAAEFTYKFAGDQAGEHPMTVRSREAAAKVNQESGGRLQVDFFPSNTLGSSVDMLKQVRLGAIQFALIADNIVQTVSPSAGISAVPFAFGSYRDAWAAMDGPLGAYTRTDISKLGLYAFTKCWDSGLRQVINAVRPLNTPADFKGLKIRVPAAPLNLATFKALGASPTPVDGSQVYVALQTHLVDGAEGGMQFFQAQKFYETQKFVSWTNHQWTAYIMLGNGDAWQKLPKNLRDIVERNFDASGVLDRNDARQSDLTLEATMAREGMAFNRADASTLKEAVAKGGLYAQLRESFGPEVWALLEKAVGKLG